MDKIMTVGHVATPHVTVDTIQKITAAYYDISQEKLVSDSRKRVLARPRQVAMWLCRQYTNRSFPDIGRRFKGRDHTTVIHACKTIKAMRLTDEDIALATDRLSQQIASITNPAADFSAVRPAAPTQNAEIISPPA